MRRKLNLKLVVGVLLGLLLVAGLVHLLHEWQLRQNAYLLLERGDQAMQSDDYDKAGLYYSQYLVFVPNDVDTVQKYAQVLDRLASNGGERVDLVIKMEQVLRAKPSEDAFRMRLVHNLIALNRIGEAMEHLKKLTGRWQDQADLHHMIGWCHEAKKDYNQAVLSFRAALKLKPTQIKSWALLAEVLQDRLSQPDAALVAMNEMVIVNKDLYQAYLLRSQFHRRRSEEKEAKHDLQTALKLAPHQPEVILEAADWARLAGDAAEAIRLLEDGRKRYPQNPDFYLKLAIVKIQTKNESAAIADLQEGLRNVPKSHDLTVLLIELMIDKGQHREAEAKIKELTEAGPGSTLPNYLTARLCIADKRWSEAIKLLEGVRQELRAGSEWKSRVHVLLGMCYHQLGDHEQELLAFRRAVSDEPSWMVANLGLGAALLSNGRVEEAATLLETLRTAKEIPEGYWLLLSRALLQRQVRTPNAPPQWDKINQALAKAAQAQPNDIQVPILRAEMLAAQKDYGQAKTLLEKCKAEHPQEILVWCALADLAALQEQWQQAETILDQVAAQKDFAPRIEWRQALARLWGRHNTGADLAKLVRLTEGLSKIGPVAERTQLRRELADLWYRLGNWERAGRLWRDIAQEHPRDLRSRSWLLELALEKDQPEVARQWLGEIHQIEGEQGALWRYGTAAILVREAHGQRQKLDEARKMLKELKPFQQDWPRVALLSATIYEMKGQYQKAIGEYMRALEMGEIQPRMMTRLLELLLEQREYGKAEMELTKYEQKLPLTKDLARLGAEAALGMRDKKYTEVALRRAKVAVTLPTQDYRDLLWLARFYQAAGDTKQTEKLLLESIASAGHTPDTWIALVEHFMQTSQPKQALKTLERMRKELPQDRQPLTLARCYEAMYQPDQAAKAYRDALQAKPDDFTLLAFAADYFRRADQADEAQKLYERLLTPAVAAPAAFTVKARRHLAILLAQLGDAASCKKALALLDENSKSRGDTITEVRLRLFIESQRDRKSSAALNKFLASLDQQQPAPEERMLLAQMLEAAGKMDQARAQLSEVLDQYPLTPMYLVRFARLLIKTGELDEAQRVINRLETLEPGSARLQGVKAALAMSLLSVQR